MDGRAHRHRERLDLRENRRGLGFGIPREVWVLGCQERFGFWDTRKYFILRITGDVGFRGIRGGWILGIPGGIWVLGYQERLDFRDTEESGF